MKDFQISIILTAKVFLSKISAMNSFYYFRSIDKNTSAVANLEYHYNKRVTLEIEIV